MTTFVNCTPHPINLLNKEGEVVFSLPKGEVVPRLAQTTEVVKVLNDISITETQFGDTTDLPSEQEGVYLIVSRLVMAANTYRHDLLVPNELVRDEEGRILGCKSLARN